MVGYDYVISIEHEDALMSIDEGLAKAVATLKEAVIAGAAGEDVLGLVRFDRRGKRGIHGLLVAPTN